LHVVQLGEYFGERYADGCAGDGELGVDAGLGTVGCCDPGVTADGVYEPDVFDAHAGVVCDALLHTVDAVFRGENFDTDERRGVDDGSDVVGASEDGHVRDAIVAGADLNADFSTGDDVPGAAIVVEQSDKDSLQ